MSCRWIWTATLPGWAIGLLCGPLGAQSTWRLSSSWEANHGSQGNGTSASSAVSADGRFVAFASAADNLVPGDSNGFQDVFVRDRILETATRVSLVSSGDQADGASMEPAISADGRFVAFSSLAEILVAGDTNGFRDVFVHDRESGTTSLVSMDSSGVIGDGLSDSPSISADGRFVAFYSGSGNLVPGDANDSGDVFLHDRQTGTTTLLSVDSSGVQANDFSLAPSISSDGRFVAFESVATNLVAQDTNGLRDVFVRDHIAGTTVRVSLSSSGAEGDDASYRPSVSKAGGFVAFTSDASNLVQDDTNQHSDVFVHDLQTGSTTRSSVDSSGAEGNHHSHSPAISPDGRLVAFVSRATNLGSGWSNKIRDVFLHDRFTGTTTRVSDRISGGDGNATSTAPSISGDGRLVAFESAADNLVPDDTNEVSDVFVRDLPAATTTRVSVSSGGVDGNGRSEEPSASGDGRFVAFASVADNLVPDDTNGVTDVFVIDRKTGETTRVSIDSSGSEANSHSTEPAISGDGRFVALASYASNLVPGDTNQREDVFVHDRLTGNTTRVSVHSTGTEGTDGSRAPAISHDGRIVAFESEAGDLVDDDTNRRKDVFVHDRRTRTTTRVSVDSSGREGNGSSFEPSVSRRGGAMKPPHHSVSEGRFVAFSSNADDLVAGDSGRWTDVFVHDRLRRSTVRVSVDSGGDEGNGSSGSPSISDDGRFVAFVSWADDLVPGDTNGASDVFVRDHQAGTTARVSVDSGGIQGDSFSGNPSISDDGGLVAFDSAATNLVQGDTNAAIDGFVHDRSRGTTTRSSVSSSGVEADQGGDAPSISGDGRLVAFASTATNLDPDDSNLLGDVFARGPDLTLEASPDAVGGGDALTFSTWTGQALAPVLLAAVEVNGTPVFVVISSSNFDVDGRWELIASVPPGLAGTVVTFQGFGIEPSGSAGLTNLESIKFQ